MNVHQVEIINDDNSFKGTWYKKGSRHFVTRNHDKVFICGWHAIDLCGGIDEQDAVEITGFVTRIKCFAVWLQVKLGARECWAHGGV